MALYSEVLGILSSPLMNKENRSDVSGHSQRKRFGDSFPEIG